MEKEYYRRWVEQVAENKKLKLELEKYKKIYESNGDFHKKFLLYRDSYEPLKHKYENLNDCYNKLYKYVEEILNIFNSHILLNENIPNIKIQENTKTEIINATRICLFKILKINKLEFYHFKTMRLNKNKKAKNEIIPVKKEFEKKNFVIKKKK